MERQRGLRALLEPALADVTLRRLHESGIRRPANNLLCTGTTLAPGTLVGATPVSTNFGCSNDWQTWWVGSRTQWNVTKDFYMGLDVMYSKMQQRQPRSRAGQL